ncbi:MAG: efflux RND transporter periplasmic adaptor subunit [Candidatus Pedobacter colombiensis]|uniref:Efflux RND transporter periplasmic adaptor subunit n=1 Tax=Candidatus Pedobacter colombiensis TaxID=3121371 RepID=A0AAJ5WFE6_9SPHI|nr:efflux RND transporter periplasmic adaptor subunit [Pedobacter sp.]WEK21567.1 MAG: efflux RND transporter periplasmic adaptor subunit [Pedobacter sp.]
MYNNPKISVLMIVATFALTCLISCNSAEPAEVVKDPQFQLNDKLLSELVVDTVKDGNATTQLTLTGIVAPDENKMVKIFPLVSGVTQDVHVQLGDMVKKGQVLASMRSVEIAGFAKDLISSEADVRNTKRILKSTQDLYESGLASEKDLEQAKSEYEKATAESKRAGDVMAINKTNSRGYAIVTPIGGYVVEKNATDHMQVRADNAENLFTIADLSTVYILINIYESDISKIQNGNTVKITTLSYPDKVFYGKIDKVYSLIDPENKVMRARVKIENPGYLLKPQMFAKVSIAEVAGSNLPFIPASAIIFDNDRNYVMIKDGQAKVHVQEITIAKRVEDLAYVSDGLKAGDQIITSRQLFLYESLKK